VSLLKYFCHKESIPDHYFFSISSHIIAWVNREVQEEFSEKGQKPKKAKTIT